MLHGTDCTLPQHSSGPLNAQNILSSLLEVYEKGRVRYQYHRRRLLQSHGRDCRQGAAQVLHRSATQSEPPALRSDHVSTHGPLLARNREDPI